MKRVMIGVALATVLLAGAGGLFIGRGADRPTSEPGRIEQTVMSMDDVAARPDRYKGEIAVKGVVSFVSAKDSVAVLISESEFATCRTVCPNVMLPVLWPGELPAITDRVLVRGKIEKTEKGYLFKATNVKIVEHGTSNDR